MKRFFLISITLILSCILISSFVACTPQAGQQQEVRVGCLNALTGMYAGFGQGGVFGVKAAVDDINKLGGVKVGNVRMPIKLIVVDDESDQNKTGTLAESMIIQDKVKFIVSGDEPPPMHAGVSNVCERYKIPYVTSVGPIEPWLGMKQETETKWKYTWATGLFAIAMPASGNDFRAGKAGYTVMDTWIDMLKLFGGKTNKKMAVLASDDADGVGWYATFGPELTKLGYDCIGIDKKLGLMPMETTDFSSVIKQWKDANVELLWGNCPAPFFGAFWKQAQTLGFKPKMVCIGRAPLFYQDIIAWGGDLPLGIGVEVWWDSSLKDSPGIGGTTPISLTQRWINETKQPLNPAIGPGYRSMQVLIDAIERAGSLDSAKVQAALAATDLMTIGHRVKFDENQFNRTPIVFAQWYKTNTPQQWELKIVFSKHDFIPAGGEPIFPIPYK